MTKASASLQVGFAEGDRGPTKSKLPCSHFALQELTHRDKCRVELALSGPVGHVGAGAECVGYLWNHCIWLHPAQGHILHLHMHGIVWKPYHIFSNSYLGQQPYKNLSFLSQAGKMQKAV